MDDNTAVFGVAGYFKAEAYRPSDGRRRELTGWCKNLITDNGMNKLAGQGQAGSFYTALRVGSGSTAPAVTDTTLVAHVASVAGGTPTETAPVWTDENPYGVVTTVYTFAVGAATGNLTELGLAGSATVNSTYLLFTRALFQDGSGNPATVVVGSDEQLIVTYQIRIYIPTTPTTATVTNTSTGVSYTISMLPSGVGTYSSLSSSGFLSAGFLIGPTSSAVATFYYYGTASGSLGALNSVPSGTSGSGNATWTAATYTTGTFYRDWTVLFPLTVANVADIGGFATPISASSYYAPCRWQWTISPKITKTSDQTLSFSFRMAVARV